MHPPVPTYVIQQQAERGGRKLPVVGAAACRWGRKAPASVEEQWTAIGKRSQMRSLSLPFPNAEVLHNSTVGTATRLLMGSARFMAKVARTGRGRDHAVR